MSAFSAFFCRAWYVLFSSLFCFSLHHFHFLQSWHSSSAFSAFSSLLVSRGALLLLLLFSRLSSRGQRWYFTRVSLSAIFCFSHWFLSLRMKGMDRLPSLSSFLSSNIERPHFFISVFSDTHAFIEIFYFLWGGRECTSSLQNRHFSILLWCIFSHEFLTVSIDTYHINMAVFSQASLVISLLFSSLDREPGQSEIFSLSQASLESHFSEAWDYCRHFLLVISLL